MRNLPTAVLYKKPFSFKIIVPSDSFQTLFIVYMSISKKLQTNYLFLGNGNILDLLSRLGWKIVNENRAV